MHHHPKLHRRKEGERGASLVEYALLVALIAVVCIVAVTFVGTSGSSKFDKAGKGIDGTVASTAPGVYLVGGTCSGGTCTCTYSNGATTNISGMTCPEVL